MKYDSILLSSINYKENKLRKKLLLTNDNDLIEWQEYSIKKILEMKNSSKKTLPVIASSSDLTKDRLVGGIQGKRSRRYGSNQIAILDGDDTIQSITGPPSYLDVYKKHYKKNRGGKIALL